MTFDNFYRVMRYLKSVSTSKYPIKVRRINMAEGLQGSCEEKDGYFLIKIDRNLSEDHSIDVLLHEIAHADSWSHGINHDVEWAVAYCKLYKHLISEE